MTAEVTSVQSRNGKLNTDMTLDSVREGTYKSERAKNKAISVFVKADKNNDGKLDAGEIKSYDRKQAWKTAGIIIGSVLGAAVLTAGVFKLVSPDKFDIYSRKAKGYVSKFLGIKNREAKDLIASQKEIKDATEIDIVRAIRRNATSSEWRDLKTVFSFNVYKGKEPFGSYTGAVEKFFSETFHGDKNIKEMLLNGRAISCQTVGDLVRFIPG